MTDWKRKKLWLEQGTGQLYTQKYLLLRVTSIIRKIVSNNCPGEKKQKEWDQLFQTVGSVISNDSFYTKNISSFLDYHLQPRGQMILYQGR